MYYIKRQIQDKVEKVLFKGKIVVIYGARQVGKTTFVKEIQKKYFFSSVYLNCDEIDIRQALADKTSTELKSFFGGKRLVIIDEAQRVKNIGITLKLIADNFPEIQVIATGSSSFDLSNEISEPLTGRKEEFYLSPFSLEELENKYSPIEMERLLEERMIFGMYPGVVTDENNKKQILTELAKSYSYKDILQYERIKNPDVLEKLLQALALQIGSEVSYNELASLLGVNKKTVENYVQILEKAFIIFRLKPFSRNLRNEIRKLRKIYFWDTGIRNALINNLNPLHLRQDTGSLWENFIISERLKRNSNYSIETGFYFWRTRQRQEIDYLEEIGGKISGYEIKWKAGSFRKPAIFLKTYAGSDVFLISRENYRNFTAKP